MKEKFKDLPRQEQIFLVEEIRYLIKSFEKVEKHMTKEGYASNGSIDQIEDFLSKFCFVLFQSISETINYLASITKNPEESFVNMKSSLIENLNKTKQRGIKGE